MGRCHSAHPIARLSKVFRAICASARLIVRRLSVAQLIYCLIVEDPGRGPLRLLLRQRAPF